MPGDLEVWPTEWGRDMYIKSETTHSKGVATLIPINMTYNINKMVTDDAGRYILISGTFNNHYITLLNVFMHQQLTRAKIK